MRRGRLFILLGVLLILILVVVALAMSGRLSLPGLSTPAPTLTPVPTEEENITVVITTQRIKRGETVTTDVVQLVEIDKSLELEQMFKSVDEVDGLWARVDLEAGVFLTEGMLTDDPGQVASGGSDAALRIPLSDPRGPLVAVSIPINRLSSVSYGLRAGDHVNVIVTMQFVDLDPNYQSILPNAASAVIAPGPAVVITVSDNEGNSATNLQTDELLQALTAQITTGGQVSPIGRVELDPTLGQPFYVAPSESQRPRLLSQTLIQNAVVLNIGDFALQDEEPAAQATPTPDPDAEPTEEVPVEGETAAPQNLEKPPDVITLIVTPQDAVTLNYLIYSGAQLSLAMRHPLDTSVVDRPIPVTLQYLLDQHNISVPAKLPYGMEPRIDVLEPPVLENDIIVETPQP